jgi:hypothetical protein
MLGAPEVPQVRPFDFPILQIEFLVRRAAGSGQCPFWQLAGLVKPALTEQVALERGCQFGLKARGLAEN